MTVKKLLQIYTQYLFVILTFASSFDILSLISRQHGNRVALVSCIKWSRNLGKHVKSELKLRNIYVLINVKNDGSMSPCKNSLYYNYHIDLCKNRGRLMIIIFRNNVMTHPQHTSRAINDAHESHQILQNISRRTPNKAK